MTKTLTEQWREGTLEHGFYYLKSSKGFTFTDHTTVKILKDNIIKKEFHFDGDIQEVLAPVPSYDKWKQMIDGDKATIHHLKKILSMIEYNKVAYDYLKQVIEDMEKEIEEVK